MLTTEHVCTAISDALGLLDDGIFGADPTKDGVAFVVDYTDDNRSGLIVGTEEGQRFRVIVLAIG